MGIILLEPFSCKSGVIIQTGVYICISNQSIYVRRVVLPNEQVYYSFHCSFEVYYNKSAKDNNKLFLETIFISEELSSVPNISPYELLYNKLKAGFSNFAEA